MITFKQQQKLNSPKQNIGNNIHYMTIQFKVVYIYIVNDTRLPVHIMK